MVRICLDVGPRVTFSLWETDIPGEPVLILSGLVPRITLLPRFSLRPSRGPDSTEGSSRGVWSVPKSRPLGPSSTCGSVPGRLVDGETPPPPVLRLFGPVNNGRSLPVRDSPTTGTTTPDETRGVLRSGPGPETPLHEM